MTPPRKRLIAVIGSGDIGPEHPQWSLAATVGATLVQAGCRVLTGGLGGVMTAASRGAHQSPDHTSGDVVALVPGSDPSVANPWTDVVIPTGLGHARNLLCAHADGVIAVGGGAGTLSEIAFAWILGRPIVALRVEGWSGRLADTALDERRGDRVVGADDGVEAVAQMLHLLGRP